MTPPLTKEFKAEAIHFILNKSRQVILEKFDKNNKCNKSIKYDNDILNIEISKNCFLSFKLPSNFNSLVIMKM